MPFKQSPSHQRPFYAHLLARALAPLKAEDVLKLEVGRVDREEVRAVAADGRDTHLAVYVEHALLAAWRPHHRDHVQLVVLEVVILEGALELGCKGGLCRDCQYSIPIHIQIEGQKP